MTILLLAALLSTNELGYVDRLVETHDPRTSLCRFVDYERACGTQDFVLNTNFWLRGIDFSCVSPWNSAGGRLRAGTAISKRHIVFAKHFPLGKDTRILFVGEDGGVCPCYVAATREVPGTDIMVGSLNAELTPNIVPAKVLPENYAGYIGDGGGFPVVTFNQHEKAFLTYLAPLSPNPRLLLVKGREPSSLRQRRFRERIVVGDSGNPAFLLLDGQAVLLYTIYGDSCGSGHGLHAVRREVQAAMDALCPGYRLESFDFAKSLSR